MYREILTKAIIAKGEKEIIDNITCMVNEPVSKVLGCWIINHKTNASLNNQSIIISGSYQAYLWYGHTENTSSALKMEVINFNDEIPYNFTLEKSVLTDNNQVLHSTVIEPSCISMDYTDNTIKISIKRKYCVDIIGETKIKIKVDEVIIDEMINTNYMNKTQSEQ